MKPGVPKVQISFVVRHFAGLALLAALAGSAWGQSPPPLTNLPPWIVTNTNSAMTNPPVVHASGPACPVAEGVAVTLGASFDSYLDDWEWYFNGQPSYHCRFQYGYPIPSAALADSGDYYFVATNAYGRGTSEVVRLTVVPSGPLEHWTEIRSGSADPTPLRVVLYGNGRFVAPRCDDDWKTTEIFISDDGTNWVDSGVDFGFAYSRGIFSDGRFVLLASEDEDGNGTIVTSTNGLDWSVAARFRYDCEDGNCLEDMAWSNGRYVIIGGDGAVTSTDGATWQTVANTTTAGMRSLAAGHGMFLAGGYGGLSLSPDGLEWSAAFRPVVFPSQFAFESLAFGNGVFVACGTFDTWHYQPWIGWSADGTNWTAAEITGLDTNKTFSQVSKPAYGPNGFVMLVRSFGPRLFNDIWEIDVLTSPNGKVWTRHAFPVNTFLWGVQYGGGFYFAAGEENVIFSSVDGQNWQQRLGTSTRTINAVAGDAAHGVAVGDGGLILTSTDALNWTDHNGLTSENLYGVIYHNGRYIAVGGNSRPFIATSPDGKNWDFWSDTTGQPLVAVAAEGEDILAVGLGGTVVKREGDSWSTTVAASASDFMSVTRFANQWIAVARSCRVCYPTSTLTFYSSSDGLTWTPRLTNSPTSYTFTGRSVFATGPDYVIASGLNQRFISSNGLDWVYLDSKPYAAEIAYGGGTFVTEYGYLYSSTNGLDWVAHQRPGQTLLGIALGRVFCGTFGERFFCSAPLDSTPQAMAALQRQTALPYYIGGEAGHVLRLQSSPDLRSWSDLGLITNPPSLRWSVPIEQSQQQKFFRVVEP